MRQHMHAVFATAWSRDAAHGEAVAELTRRVEEQEQRVKEFVEVAGG